MLPTINKDTVLCMSLAGRPGNFGTRFHNFLYRELGLNFVYKAFTTTDLPAAIAAIRALNIRGCAVSMPFKEDCIPLLDVLEPSARAIGSVNTIVNDGGELTAYNTDFIAVSALLDTHAVPRDGRFLLRGSGGMARAVVAALRDKGFEHGTIWARNEQKGRALADEFGYAWRAEPEAEPAAMLVNVTPVGMAGGADADATSFPEAMVRAADTVFDVVAIPAETALVRLGRAHGRRVITGAEVIALQALEQFVLYTGTRPDPALVERAAAFARG
ncbi:shikimate 5-dehydrogenase [Rhizosaccharibacter radicis]|uniref:Shikimate 5-dehydrogenase n=1 Tax=Rhizosaccharibacter radicis TaxID=2782605 RepID=A0ABT1W0R0_9PROT|nr:shikimate 5-dehydrogenase [Acetobacteraceae bacterium KSS12]